MINSLTTGTNIKPGQKIISWFMAKLSLTIDGSCVSSDDQSDLVNQLMIFRHWTPMLQLLDVPYSSLVKSARETCHLMLEENVAAVYDIVWFLANVLEV